MIFKEEYIVHEKLCETSFSSSIKVDQEYDHTIKIEKTPNCRIST